jgi:hypothetical protein
VVPTKDLVKNYDISYRRFVELLQRKGYIQKEDQDA